MGFWLSVLKAAAEASQGESSNVKIQIRRTDENIWRDFSFVSDNAESVQNGIQLAASAYPEADVRALSPQGSFVDFR